MKNNQTGITFLFLQVLTLMFAYFKLTGVISWSWWLVFFPLYIPFLIVVFVVAGVFSIIICVVIADKILDFLISIFSKQ